MAALFDHRTADRHRRRALAGAAVGTDFLMKDRRAKPIEGRRIGDRLGRQRIVTEIES